MISLQFHSRIRGLTAAVGLCGCLLGQASVADAQSAGGAGSGGAAGEGGVVGIASRTAARKQQQTQDATDLIKQGDQLRSYGQHEEAFGLYTRSLQSVPRVPGTMELRRVIVSRYQRGALDYANQLIEAGDYDEAEDLLASVMTTMRDGGFDPASIDPRVRELLGNLRGDYFNKADNREHKGRVSQVSRDLITGQGHLDLGNYGEAIEVFNRVLNVDPTNEAARRGMERAERHMMEYAKTAYGHTRAKMLREVAQSWESPVPPSISIIESSGAGDFGQATPGAVIQEKLQRIVIPNLTFEQAPLTDVLAYLSQQATLLDTLEPDPAKRGVNFVLDPGQAGAAGQSLVTIQISNVPLGTALNYTLQLVGMKYRVDEYAVKVLPASAPDDADLQTRRYQVPPDFISGGGGGAGAAAPINPFDVAPGGGDVGGALVRRVTAREFLEGAGITFPPGAVATYMANNSTLIVRNTADNLALIDTLVQNSRIGSAKTIQVDYRVLRVTQETLNELGFDWLLGQFNVPGSEKVFGGGGTLGNQIGRAPGDYPFNFNGSPIGGQPVTAGLRSGAVQSLLTVEDVIARDNPGSSSEAAPAVFGVAGVFTDPQFQFVVRALNQSTGVDRVCNASVFVRPGQRAIIKQVREFIYPTEYDPPEIPDNVGSSTIAILDQFGNIADAVTEYGFAATPAHPTAFEMRELGKILEVEPTLGEDNLTVNLNLIWDMSDFLGFINYGTPIENAGSSASFQFNPFVGFSILRSSNPYTVMENEILMPVFEAVKETTNVTVWDGQTVAIGGLFGESITDVEDKVPGLGDIPGAGRLFRSSIDQRRKTALIMFVSVRVLDPAGQPVNDLSEVIAGN